jgi:transcriptional regulator GlxA family with amidase domain
VIVRGGICGIVGISRDLGQPIGRHPTYVRLRKVLAHMQAHHDERIHITALARLAGMSVAQLERHFRHVFQLTPQQVLTKFRIDSAMRLLQGDEAIASIGQACGYVDQSAFARQFKATVGMAPRVYRRLMGSGNGRPPVSGD